MRGGLGMNKTQAGQQDTKKQLANKGGVKKVKKVFLLRGHYLVLTRK